MNHNTSTQELASAINIQVQIEAKQEKLIRENIAKWNASEWHKIKSQTQFNKTFNAIGQKWPIVKEN